MSAQSSFTQNLSLDKRVPAGRIHSTLRHSSRRSRMMDESADRRQKFITGAVVITILWTLWAVAGMTAWALTGTAILSVITFALLFLPTGQRGCGGSASRNFMRLLKFPLFWIGLLLCTYITIQGLNPSYEAVWRNYYWTNYKLTDAISWLPTSVKAVFGFDVPMGMNPWRQLCIFGSAWLMLCALWCGLRSRKMWKILIWILVINAVIMAVHGLYKLSVGNTSYLFYRKSVFTSVFVYKNQAAEFFILSISLCVAFALRIWRRSVFVGARGGPHLILIIFGLIMLGMVFATKSVGGVTLGLVWLPLSIILVFSSRMMTKTSWAVFGIFALLFVGLIGVWWTTVDTNPFMSRVDRKVQIGELPDVEKVVDLGVPAKNIEKETFSINKGPRADLRKLSSALYHMDSHIEIFGWGAGSYRWIAPSIQRRMEEFLVKNRRTGKYYLPLRTEYAHCDPWQMLVEWGAVGTGIFAAGALWFLGFAFWNIRRWHVSSVALLAGIAIFVAHSLVDFMIYNPALLMTLVLIMAAFKADLSRRKTPKRKENSNENSLKVLTPCD